jgi:pyrroloquinoline quinone biosynthesis protein B
MSRLRVIVIGSAAGGGYPQWNCRGPISSLFWDGDSRVEERTQSSIAVSSDGESWALLNCSPDMRQQILRTPALWPKHPPRDSPIKAVLLTNGDIDHVAGLLTLREKQGFRLLGTRTVLEVLKNNSIFAALDSALVERVPVELGQPFPLVGDLTAEIFAVPGKVPLYLEEGEPEIGQEGETTVGVKIGSGEDAHFFYVPGCAQLSDGLRQRLQGAPLLLFDGTLWRDDEMIRSGVGQKTGKRMGHISLSGPDGSLAAFADMEIGRKVFVHINNTNPVLVQDSPERREAEAAGWEIAFDGMELAL